MNGTRIKCAANLAEHNLDFADAGELEWHAAVIVPDTRFGYGEDRFRVFGMFRGHMHTISFTRRGEATRIISFRFANRKEKKRYGPFIP